MKRSVHFIWTLCDKMEPVMNDKGQLVIPGSRRPDGTYRKDVIVREGFKPQEEMKVFETKASKSSKGKSIPGLAPAAAAIAKPPPTTRSNSVKVDKNVTKREVKVEKEATSAMQTLSLAASLTESATSKSTEPVVAVSNEKRIKAIKKKLREIDELNSRDPSTLSVEQQEKLLRKTVLEEELKSIDS